MITIVGSMTLDPAVIPEFKTAFAAMRPGVLEEPGVIHYSLLLEDEAAGIVNVTEIWESEEALKTHLALPVTADFFAKFGPSMIASTIQLYDLSNARAIPL